MFDPSYPGFSRISGPNNGLERHNPFGPPPPSSFRSPTHRPSISPPKTGTGLGFPRTTVNNQIHQKSLPSTVSDASLTKPFSSIASKRSRSPPVATNQALELNNVSTKDSSEREMLAKAKRLARFKVELSKSEKIGDDVAEPKVYVNRRENHTGSHPAELKGAFTGGLSLSDYDGMETSNVIIGLCPDMCPESEREERERKGDLDQYERLDGDRNASSRFLAVKKYNRTAEREANLIRPMPILQKTIDYLLNLLDQPYDDKFLGIYNFLWDRMRAVRMDLRMQHIFNQGAITMLEQMIRLHIIAMHELCEYTKGEGFSEGYDAHLNIEQMNKTSVELFQMYDDHRKRGINVPTEKEFRGYYALLKLDKHPGYKVEPAELSLDLAKMTPEIRQTPEVLFARSVARACRTGNFITFFRLARKASYLQACLMHAHFAKLRTQALASLHAGLQNNQGVPAAHVANWLGMEDEDIEDLLEYHGFLLKAYEEPYMVKEGPFLNVNNDYPTKSSRLVQMKRSGTVVLDVSPPIHIAPIPDEVTSNIQMNKVYKKEPRPCLTIQNKNSVQNVDEEMTETKVVFSPKYGMLGQVTAETTIAVPFIGKDHHLVSSHQSPFRFPSPINIIEQQPSGDRFSSLINSDITPRISRKRNFSSEMDVMPPEVLPKTYPKEKSVDSFSIPVLDFEPQNVSEDKGLVIQKENEIRNDEEVEKYQDEEIAEAKMKLYIRLWKRRCSKLRKLREHRQLAAVAALNSLSMGMPIRQNKIQTCSIPELDIDSAMRERYLNHEMSCVKLNVSDITADILCQRNPSAKCLCWKLVLCSQASRNGGEKKDAAWSWLLSKLMPSSDDDLVMSSPGLAIWRKWTVSQASGDLTCCLSIVKDTKFSSLHEIVSGASAVLFLASDCFPWELQRSQLHDLLTSIPSGARLPLLVLCCLQESDISDSPSVLINELGLHAIDKSRISSFLAVSLVENQQMRGYFNGFFSDKQLKEGLEWLASESSVQPIIYDMKTHDIIHTHLNSLFRVRDGWNSHNISPAHCISIFNEALDGSILEIAAAANSNPADWPCPEISLLEEFSYEHNVVNCHLPKTGWSSAAKLEPLVHALGECKLPGFPDNLFWLAKGSNIRTEIENQKLKLENCLVGYLTNTSKMMGVLLAKKEACVMLQRYARLELHDSCYHIVPQWVMIFRRIFNWRMMNLSAGPLSSAYILEDHHTILPHLESLALERNLPSSNCLEPSLDEMIEVSFSALVVHPRLELGVLRPPQTVAPPNNVVHEADNTRVLLMNTDESNLVACIYNNGRSSYQVKEGKVKATKEAERLSKMLEQCNILQRRIDERLSLYF